MAIDWRDAEAKARVTKRAIVQVMKLTHAVNTGAIEGRPLHADTLADLKTVDGPAARAEARAAWDDLDAAMTP